MHRPRRRGRAGPRRARRARRSATTVTGRARQLDLLPRPDPRVRPLPVHLDRADTGWAPAGSRRSARPCAAAIAASVTPPGVGRGRRSRPRRRRCWWLTPSRIVAGRPCVSARGGRAAWWPVRRRSTSTPVAIGSRVPACPTLRVPSEPAHPGHHVVRGQARRLVHDQQPRRRGLTRSRVLPRRVPTTSRHGGPLCPSSRRSGPTAGSAGILEP